MPNNPNRAFLAYQQEKTYVGTGESEDEEPGCEDLRDGTPGYLNETFLTRQEQKALDREIPWRDIVDKGGKYLRGEELDELEQRARSGTRARPQDHGRSQDVQADHQEPGSIPGQE